MGKNIYFSGEWCQKYRLFQKTFQMKVQFTALLCILNVKKEKELQKKLPLKSQISSWLSFFVTPVTLIFEIPPLKN